MLVVEDVVASYLLSLWLLQGLSSLIVYRLVYRISFIVYGVIWFDCRLYNTEIEWIQLLYQLAMSQVKCQVSSQFSSVQFSSHGFLPSRVSNEANQARYHPTSYFVFVLCTTLYYVVLRCTYLTRSNNIQERGSREGHTHAHTSSIPFRRSNPMTTVKTN